MSTTSDTPDIVLLKQGTKKSYEHDIYVIKKTDSQLGFIDSFWIVEKIHSFNGRPAKEEPAIPFSDRALNDLVQRRVAFGAKIVSVKGKPFPSGYVPDAVAIVSSQGNWDLSKTAQPEKKIEKRDVVVTVSAGQVAPIW